VLKEEPESIKEFETMVQTYLTNRLKDDGFLEAQQYWKTIKEKSDLDESRGFKSKDNELINEKVSVDCKKLNFGLLNTYCMFVWGALGYIHSTIPVQFIPNLPLLSTFIKNNDSIPWCIVNKLLKQHLSHMETDSDNISIHVNRKKAQDFAQQGKVDLKGEHTIFS